MTNKDTDRREMTKGEKEIAIGLDKFFDEEDRREEFNEFWEYEKISTGHIETIDKFYSEKPEEIWQWHQEQIREARKEGFGEYQEMLGNWDDVKRKWQIEALKELIKSVAPHPGVMRQFGGTELKSGAMFVVNELEVRLRIMKEKLNTLKNEN